MAATDTADARTPVAAACRTAEADRTAEAEGIRAAAFCGFTPRSAAVSPGGGAVQRYTCFIAPSRHGRRAFRPARARFFALAFPRPRVAARLERREESLG